MKQTAVEWLEQEIFRKYKFTLQQLNCQPLEEAIQQAKEMEKQQSYSEKDMAESFMACWTANVPYGFECKLSFNEWFEQFKNK